MRRTVVRAFAALATFGIATTSVAADDVVTWDDIVTCSKGELGDEAIAVCSRIISRRPGDVIHFIYRGAAYQRKSDYDRAIADFDQAIRLDPNDAFATAYNSRGNAYNAKGDYDRAIADFDQAIRLHPNLVASYNNRGLAYNGKGDYDRAISDLDRAVQLDPNFANPYSHRGYAYGKKGDFDRAMADLNKALSLNPKYARGYANRAAIYELRGDASHAIEDASEAIRLDPKAAFAYNVRGMAYFDKRQHALAMIDYEQALRLDPLLSEVRQNHERAQAALATSQTAQVRNPAVPSSAPAERRVALVIGNSGYTSSLVSALPNPRRDAKLVADALRQAGFETVELTDLDLAGMVKALRAFRGKADSADWALVYFAGHGIEINRANYLLPIDAKLEDSRDVKRETVSYEDFAEAIGGAKALRIIILDACRNNPFKASMRQTVALRGSLERGLAAPPEAEPGTLVVYSAKEGEAAVDGDGANSPFALAFVKQVKMPGREVRRMFDYVSDDVIEATGKRQQPFMYGRLPASRDFFFVAGK
jgi:tetratricopeptide (TPR) repeat protein